MPVTFDGNNKLIRCTSGTRSLNVQQDLYMASKDWLTTVAGGVPSNLHWPPPFSESIGGQALGSGKFAGRTFFLANGWKVLPDDADHTLTIDGNLFRDPADSTPALNDVVPGRTVVVAVRPSIEAQGISTGGSTSTSSPVHYTM